jgi:hypothetical protein
MLRNKLVRRDGSVIDSSVIISCEFTEEVNSNTNLYYGDITSSELSVEIRSTEAIQQGEVLTYYMIEDGVETRIGEFNVEKPTVASRSSLRFSAYDNISKTEKLFSGWLRDNQYLFPMTAMNLVYRVCSHCGVTYAGGEFPNQDIQINAFYADDITCRQILSWVGALAGRFVRANAAGEIEFAQYTENLSTGVTYRSGYANPINIVVTDKNGNVVITSDEMTVTDDEKGNVVAKILDVSVVDVDGNVTLATGTAVPYLQGSLTYETYQTDKIERVQIKHSDDDVGVIYPAEATGNCYVISRNMLLGTCSTEDVTVVAQTLYEQLKSVTYVPFSVRLPRTLKVRAGEIIGVRDINGRAFISLIMKMNVAANGVTISSTGDKSYESAAVVASEKFTNLTGKVLEISKNVDGLSVKNKSLDGRVGSLELNTGAFQVQIRDEVDSLSKIAMTSEKVDIIVSDAVAGIDSIKTSTGYTFNKDGLNIHKDGEEMHNTLDNNGMYVRKNGTDVLVADKDGVNAVNLTARKYFVIGNNARFEDYPGNRTACFYIGG